MKKRRRFSKNKREYVKNFVENRISYFNKFYNFEINRIAIKNQKSRWGSCSKRKNLNFNYKIIYLKPALADYLIAHELCHLGQFNHSRKFWDLVEKTIPDYKKINRELKNMPINIV